MSRDGYLPPGVESYMIPGNRPEDELYEKFTEDKDEMFGLYKKHFGKNPKDWDEMVGALDIDWFRDEVDKRFDEWMKERYERMEQDWGGIDG